MAQKSLFWNALPDSAYPTGYDRNYNGDDISDWLATVLTTGVIKSDTALKVTPSSDMIVSVDAGKAVINGKPYIHDVASTLTVPTAPTGSTARADLVVLRFDKTVSTRDTYLAYISGGANGAIPAIKRNLTYYDLAISKITVQPNATAINAGDITDLRGDNTTPITIEGGGTSLGFCPWLVAAKGYDDYYDAIVLRYTDEIILSQQSTAVTFNIPQYGWTGVDIVTVYTNGIRDDETTYTITNSTITFDSLRIAGAKITVVVEKSIDGEGLGTALAGYQELQSIVLGLQSIDDYYYTCNGANDNVILSAIAQTWLNGGTDYGSKKINVCGTFGCSAANAGTGTSADRFKWFSFGQAASTNRKITFDFTNCTQLTIPIAAGTQNDIFHGNDVNIIGASVVASQTGANTAISMFNSFNGVVTADNCRFWINASASSFIAYTGTFTNCRGSVSCTAANAYCYFVSPMSQIRIMGGEYYAYSNSANTSAVVNGAAPTGVCVLYAVNCPTVARAGFVQSYAINITAGLTSITDTMTLLPITALGANVRGTLAISRAGRM